MKGKQAGRGVKQILSALVAVVFLLGAVGAQAAPAAKFAVDELLVQIKVGGNKSLIDLDLKAQGASELDEIAQIRVKRIKVPAQARERVKAALAKNPHIAFVEENHVAEPTAVPNDSSYGSQWHLPKIQAPQGWDITTGAASFPIAIIDSGVDADHPDLASKLMTGRNFLDGSVNTDDTHGHGTSVAGAAAAASNNGTGISGVAWASPIMPLQVFNSTTSALYSTIASAITWATDNGAKVINISMAGSTSSLTMENAINYAWNKGVIVVASAGNSSTSAPYYPAACKNVVSVSATTSSDLKASWSNFGATVDVAAPGASIYTTTKGGGYGSVNGTSFSSPITAGLVALIWSANPTLTNAEVVDILLQNTDDLGAVGFDESFAHGRINAFKSVSVAKSFAPQPDLTAPTATITSPGNSATVSGSVSFNVAALDDKAVAKVEFYLNGTLLGSDTTAPYSFAWNTAAAADGWHTLSAKAIDSSNNIGTSEAISVLVSNPTAPVDSTPPTVTISAPYPGKKVASRETITVQAFDNQKVVRVEVYVDGKLRSTSSSSALNWIWSTSRERSGAHTLAAKAFDAAGNVSTDSMTVYK